MTLRAKLERLAKEWEQEAERRRNDAARPGEPPSSRRMLECGAAFERSHAARIRALLAEEPQPEPRCPKCGGATEFAVLHRDGSGSRFFVCVDGSCGGGVWMPAAPVPGDATAPTFEERLHAFRPGLANNPNGWAPPNPPAPVAEVPALEQALGPDNVRRDPGAAEAPITWEHQWGYDGMRHQQKGRCACGASWSHVDSDTERTRIDRVHATACPTLRPDPEPAAAAPGEGPRERKDAVTTKKTSIETVRAAVLHAIATRSTGCFAWPDDGCCQFPWAYDIHCDWVDAWNKTDRAAPSIEFLTAWLAQDENIRASLTKAASRGSVRAAPRDPGEGR